MRRSTAALAAARLAAGLLAAGLLAACSEPEPVAVQEPPASRPTSSPAPSTAPPARPRRQAPRAPSHQPLGTVPPPWLGTRVLPERPGRLRRDPAHPAGTAQPPVHAARPAARAARPRLRLARRQPAPGRRDRPLDLARGLPGRRRRPGLDPADVLGVRRPAAHRRAARQRVRGRRPGVGVPAALRGAVPDRADGDHHPGRPGRPTDRRRQRHRGRSTAGPTTGGTSYSQHAYGLAIDVNSFQNPYVKGDLVLPELASAYLDRDRVRPGMIEPGDEVVRAFAAHRLGVGRRLAEPEGLPALQPERHLRCRSRPSDPDTAGTV